MSFEMSFTAYDEEGDEVPVTIEYTYYGGCKGATENGIPIEPDDPEEVEIVSVKDENGDDFELSDEETERFYEEAFEDARESIEDAKAEAAISRWEDERDGYYDDRW